MKKKDNNDITQAREYLDEYKCIKDRLDEWNSKVYSGIEFAISMSTNETKVELEALLKELKSRPAPSKEQLIKLNEEIRKSEAKDLN